MATIVKIPGLSEAVANATAKQIRDIDQVPVNVVPDGTGTFTVVATYPDQTPATGSASSASSASDSASKPAATDAQKSTSTTSGTAAVTLGATAASSLNDRVPIPPRDKMNLGLTACTEGTMLAKFGKPGELTADCSPPTGTFQQRVRKGFNVGPFKVTGLDYAVESLLQIFSDVRKDNQALFDQVKTDGMLCVRARRHNPARYSNHSWGTAIDIHFGGAPVNQGLPLTHRGNLLLAPYFNKYGWYWGAGFSGDSVDSMHFELAEETVLRLPKL